MKMGTERQVGSEWQAFPTGHREISCSACRRGQCLVGTKQDWDKSRLTISSRSQIYLEADAAMNTYETAEGKRTTLNLVQRKDN